jgi:hypothetical protein
MNRLNDINPEGENWQCGSSRQRPVWEWIVGNPETTPGMTSIESLRMHGWRLDARSWAKTQLAVTGSQFLVGPYRKDGVRTSASLESELSQDAALA